MLFRLAHDNRREFVSSDEPEDEIRGRMRMLFLRTQQYGYRRHFSRRKPGRGRMGAAEWQRARTISNGDDLSIHGLPLRTMGSGKTI